MRSPATLAEAAIFRHFANCYCREVDPGTPTDPSPGDVPCLQWSFPSQRCRLRAELLAPSLCGPLGFGQIWIQHGSDPQWQSVPPFMAVCTMARECYRRASDADGQQESELELLLRVLLSYQATRQGLERRTEPMADDFISAEQSLIYGHALHPTPKSLQGMADWQRDQYAPEAQGRFQLHLFAVPDMRVVQASAAAYSAATALRQVFGPAASARGVGDDHVPLPIHPLQAQALLLDPKVQTMIAAGELRDLGQGGPFFTATSSVRTVYSPDSPWMLKFSLPVRITNSLRVNRRHELAAGVIMARLIGAVGSGLPAGLRFLLDPAYITLDFPEQAESGFEVIIRENPFRGGAAAGIVTLAALTAEPPPGQRSRLACAVHQTGQSARDWFRAYLDVALVPLLALYDRYGIALEAHQQNGLLALHNGWPGAFYYRDNQGFYLAESYRANLRQIIPEADNIPGLYYSETVIQQRFSYYLIVNQIFGIIARLGQDRLGGEAELIRDLRMVLTQQRRHMRGAGGRFIDAMLDSPTLGAKFNLTIRLRNVDELAAADENALYAAIPNPMWQAAADWSGHALSA